MVPDYSHAFKALGHPHRLALIQHLLQRALICCEADRPDECSLDPTCCNFGDLVDELAINKATVSHHLKELDQAGLIERIREGRRLYVRANVDRINALRRFLDPTTNLSYEEPTNAADAETGSGSAASPIACTLTPDAFQDRVSWIRDLTDESLLSSRRTPLSLHLTYERTAAERVREFMRQEEACCAFLRFEIREEADGMHLTVTAPEEASEAADQLFAHFAPDM